ncbi:hypothetical protein D3C73_1517140 [compost metagenome]
MVAEVAYFHKGSESAVLHRVDNRNHLEGFRSLSRVQRYAFADAAAPDAVRDLIQHNLVRGQPPDYFTVGSL